MGFKLLLADDSITIQKVVSIIFGGDEYELTIVNNGTGALEKAAETVPDVMLVDTLMPGANGYEVCEKIRQDQSLRTIPILLLTGAFEPFNIEKARESGADDFISKPFESQVLIEKVKGLIELGKERQSAPVAPVTVSPIVEPSPEEPDWRSEVSPAAAPIVPPSPTVPDFSQAPESDNVWEMDFQLDSPKEVPGTEQASELLAPGPEQQSDDAVWQLDLDAGETPNLQTAGTAARTDDMIEVSPDDDLWGAFELEPVEETAIDPVDILETYTIEPGDSPADADSFSGISQFEMSSGEPAVEPEKAEDFFFGSSSVESVSSSFADATPPATVVDEVESSAGTAFDSASFVDMEEPTAQQASAETSYFFAEPAPSLSPIGGGVARGEETFFQPSAAPDAEERAPVQAAGNSSPVTLDEKQLTEVISRISREVIEKVVWEVVPDLAEMLIKEEIRKIKEGR